MASRGSSMNVNLDPVPPPPISGSSGGEPPSVATNQQSLRADAGTLETGLPQFETSSGAIPPLLPPRSTPPLHPPRSVPGPIQPSAGQNTNDTHIPLSEGSTPTSSQSPGTAYQPSPIFPRVPGQPPSNPTQHQQPAPGDGVGGFAMFSSNVAADYAYRFDTIPSPRSDSDPPHYESKNIIGGVHEKVWPIYNYISEEYDRKMLRKWNSDLDSLPTFAALFSSIVTAFLIRALDDLGPNYQQQSAILLYQILNGRDPNPGNIPNPLAPFRASGTSAAVVCLWFASLSASLCAGLGAMIGKSWLEDYGGDAGPAIDRGGGAGSIIGLIRACQRHTWYMAFRKRNPHIFMALLPPLLQSSVLLFLAGAVVYLWSVDERVGVVCRVVVGLVALFYFTFTFLPFVTGGNFRPYSMLLFHRLTVVIGKVVVPIVDVFVHGGYLTLRYLIGAVLWPLARKFIRNQTLDRWYLQSKTILPGEYEPLRVWWENSFDDSLDDIDTSDSVQEEAILWLSQMPLDPDASKPVVSSLALISSSRPHRFPTAVIVFLNMTLEFSFREEPIQDEVGTAINRVKDKANTAIDCILVLGHIKFQSAVDRNSDRDHDVGGVPVTPLVAWAAQKFADDALQPGFTNAHSEGIRARLLTAAAWLSPVEVAEGVEGNDEELKILDRFHFIEKIKNMLERHVRGERPLDTKDLVKLIHGMHAYIPRGDYGIVPSIISFFPLLYQDYDSPWSQDEAVLRALINYALDLLLPPASRKPLVEREIEFEKLASELIDTLMATTGHHEVVAFGFWLVYRVPYAFKSRKTLLTDIAHIWTSTNETIREDHRAEMTLRAIDAFVAVAQLHTVATDELPKFTTRSALPLVKAALEYEYSRPMGIYAMAMLVNLGTSTQVGVLTDGIPAEPSRRSLFDVRGDLERNSPEEADIDLHIYSALVLLKYPLVESDAGKVKKLIWETDKAIGEMSGAVEEMGGAVGDAAIGDLGVTRDSAVESSPDLDRVRWKAIYLSALLFALVPEGEKGELLEGFKAKVRAMLQDGGLPLVTDYDRCLQRLNVKVPDSRTPAGQGGPVYKAFEGWVNGFPLFPLAGSVTAET